METHCKCALEILKGLFPNQFSTFSIEVSSFEEVKPQFIIFDHGSLDQLLPFVKKYPNAKIIQAKVATQILKEAIYYCH